MKTWVKALTSTQLGRLSIILGALMIWLVSAAVNYATWADVYGPSGIFPALVLGFVAPLCIGVAIWMLAALAKWVWKGSSK